MARPLKIDWKDSVGDLEYAYRHEHDGKVKVRLYALWLLRKGNEAKDVASIIGYSYRSVIGWIKRYKEEGIVGTFDKEGRGRKSKLPNESISVIYNLIRDTNPRTLKEVRLMIMREYGSDYSISGLWRLFKRMCLSSQVPRRKHTKGDPAQQEAFKK